MIKPPRPSPSRTSFRIGPVTVPNRFVRSATHDYMAAEDGTVTGQQVELYKRLAAGEIGLIITGHAYVLPSGKASPRQIAVCDDAFIPGLARIAEAVHAYPSRIFLQLAHAGRQTKTKLIGGTPVSPSAVHDPVSGTMPRELTSIEIRDLIRAFIAAGGRAVRAGYDGVQLHVAHGYLLSAFISPHTNRRIDEWGGSPANRARVVVEIVRGIKDAAGSGFPVMVKLNSTDFLAGGLTLEESVEIATLLEAAGIDGIEVSGGIAESRTGSVWPGLRDESGEGYFVSSASSIKAAVRIPVSGLGGIRTLAVAERFIADGLVDSISMSRPFIRDPGLIRAFRTGEAVKSLCISCNKCFNPRGICCAEIGG
jgi:2,4-dienoyl-CoA reductase-like NADH-dependent reductase (Old Yellow Enzyme family)